MWLSCLPWIPGLAVVQVAIAPGCETMVDDILKSLCGEVEMTPVDNVISGGAICETAFPPAYVKQITGN
jgi:hypothetical protein